jgi:hypothetical protein
MTGYLAFIFFASIAGNPTDATLTLHWKDAINPAQCLALTKARLDTMQGAPAAVSYFCADPNAVAVLAPARPQALNITINPTFEVDGPSMVGASQTP